MSGVTIVTVLASDAPRVALAEQFIEAFNRGDRAAVLALMVDDPVVSDCDYTTATVARGLDTALTTFQRLFVYLPFEHAETLDDQDRSVRLFETLRDALGADTVDYAHRHRAVIVQFGRFPHRNAILGRAGTAAEEEDLARPGSGF